MPRPQKPPQVYQHRKSWYCRFTAHGRQYIAPCGAQADITRDEAEATAAGLKARKLAQLEHTFGKKRSETALARHLRRIGNKSESHQLNCTRFEERLQEFFEGRVNKLADFEQEDIEAWRDWLLKCKRKDGRPGTLGYKTVKEHIDWLASVYNNAGMENKCAGVERPKRTHAEDVEALEFFTPGEMARLLEVAASAHPTFYNGFIAYAYTGCRASEIQKLRPEDLDTANQIIWVTGKGKKRRALKLTGPIQPAWDAIMREARSPTVPKSTKFTRAGYIFPQYTSWPMKVVKSICKTAFDGAKEGHPHMLRHTLASMALLHFKPAWDIAYLAKWLGHKDISITYRTYSHWIAIEAPSSYKPATDIKTASANG